MTPPFLSAIALSCIEETKIVTFMVIIFSLSIPYNEAWCPLRPKYNRPIGENIGRILEMLNRKLEEYWKY